MPKDYKNKFIGYQYWLRENHIYEDLRQSEYNFMLRFFNRMKPKKVLSIGGYTNFDTIFCCKDLDDCSIVNVDELALHKRGLANEDKSAIMEKQKLIIEKVKYKGKYKFIEDTFDPKKLFEQSWDVIWEGVADWGSPVYNIPTTSIYIKYIYSNPLAFYKIIPEIDKRMPLVLLGKSIAIFGDFSIYPLNELKGYIDGYIEWPFDSTKRKIPVIKSNVFSEDGNWNVPDRLKSDTNHPDLNDSDFWNQYKLK